MHLDVATGGEMQVALAADVPADRLVLHGNNKSRERTDAWRSTLGVGRIVVDSFDEIDRTRDHPCRRPAQCHADRACCALTPGVEAHTHEYIATGQDDSKFGFTVSNGRRHRDRGRIGPRRRHALDVMRHSRPHRVSQVFRHRLVLRAAAQVHGRASATPLRARRAVGGRRPRRGLRGRARRPSTISLRGARCGASHACRRRRRDSADQSPSPADRSPRPPR